ncbi:sugar ABC transporter substrate-binding protein [Litoreibacter roseus]|uniref:Sugar ABC transporter substrate-binding protein n=2 Tax=Litoreibacter roseus TaxID=2601869 RepID=A0A6N6JDZ9_9RHOB|nr:sugar ABC transporter substrate-binding protein [Litoreibacter roseus]
MKHLRPRSARVALFFLVALMVASCGLPRSGPRKAEIFSGSVEQEGNAYIVTVDQRVAREASKQPALGFTDGFLSAGVVGSDIIRPGDVLGLTIWENVDDGLLAQAGASATDLTEVQVDGDGFIFVPYAGRMKASGNTPEGLRRVITGKLESQTPDPQVLVRRLAGDGSTVTVVGGVSQQGVFPIERPTRTLSAMLAQAGGVAIPTEVALITLLRGGHRSTVWFEDLFTHPEFDVALRGNDRILVEQDSRAFTVLGATGGQARVEFETQMLSAIEALAQVGGLSTNIADPTGIFIFRDEPENIAQNVLGRNDINGTQRLAYILDLTRPTGVFDARDFSIRDGDTIYVTEAPFVTWNKTISALTGSLQSANALTAATGTQ